MQLTIKAETLKGMVSRSIKGVGNNKLIPLTSLMCISVTDDVLTLVTTDATNYLYIKERLTESSSDGEDFYVVVPVEVFSKLIARMTCDVISLSVVSGKVLEVVGNGSYSIELPMDEKGDPVKYPDPIGKVELVGEGNKVAYDTIRSILTSVRPSLAVTLELPCYTGYYVGDRVVGTDTYKIACLDTKFVDQPLLISADTMNLLAVMSADSIDMDILEDAVVFTSPDCCIYSSKMQGIEDFQINEILGLVDMEFPSSCNLSKAALLQALDRVSLFVSPYDKNGINLEFGPEGLQISSKSSSGTEMIEYLSSENAEAFACMIDIEAFVVQLKAQTGESVKLSYGETNAIKMVDGNLTQVVALMEDSES